MTTFLEKILLEKQKEVEAIPEEKILPKRDTGSFYEFLKKHDDQVQLIAEVKKASPSKGEINSQVDVVAQAVAYEKAGAGAISVLTDPAYFQGSIEDLRAVANAVKVPVLCKDFIIDKKQIIRGRNAGASIVLLIVAALSQEKLEELYKEAIELDLEVLVEVHNEAELVIAEQLGAKLIGVNNRDLHSFEVKIEVSKRLAKLHQKEQSIYISESGFKTSEDVMIVKDSYQAILVGEALMREKNPTEAAKKLKVKRKRK